MEEVIVRLFAPLLVMTIIMITAYWVMKAAMSVASFARNLLDD